MSYPHPVVREGFVQFLADKGAWKKRYLRLDSSTLSVFKDAPGDKSPSKRSWFGSSKKDAQPRETVSIAPGGPSAVSITTGDAVKRKFKKEFVIEVVGTTENGPAKPIVFQAMSKQEFLEWKGDLQSLATPPVAPPRKSSRILQHPLQGGSSSSSSSDTSSSSGDDSSENDSSTSEVSASDAGAGGKKMSSANDSSSSSSSSSATEQEISQSSRRKDSKNSVRSSASSMARSSMGGGALRARGSPTGEPSAVGDIRASYVSERRDSVRDRVQKLEEKLHSGAPSPTESRNSAGGGGSVPSSSLDGLGDKLVLDTNHLRLDMPSIKPVTSGSRAVSQRSAVSIRSSGTLGTLESRTSPTGLEAVTGTSVVTQPPWVPTEKPVGDTPATTPGVFPPGMPDPKDSYSQFAQELGKESLSHSRVSNLGKSELLSKSRRITDPLAESGLDGLGVSLHNVCHKRTSMSRTDKLPTKEEIAAIMNDEDEEEDGQGHGEAAKDFSSSTKQLDGIPEHSISGSTASICEQEEVSFRWDDRLRFYIKNNPGAISQLLGEFCTESVDFARKFIDHLCYNIESEDVDRARQTGPGMLCCALNNGIFYRLIVDADDHTKDETELALNGAEVRCIRYLVAHMTDHLQANQDCPFNGHLTVTVDYAGYRVFCQAVQPLENCGIACGWFPDKSGKMRYLEPDASTKDALKLIQDTLNLKRTLLKLKDNPNARRVRLCPSQLLHRDQQGKYYLGRQRTSLLVPLAETIQDVDPSSLNFLRPELQVKLPYPVSCIPGFDFCLSCVDGCPQSDTLKSEIVEACTTELREKAIREFVEELDSGRRFPVDSADLRKHFHAAGINMTFLGTVYHQVSLPYIKHLCLCDAIARVIKRGIRECCHNTQDKGLALSYATTWFANVMQYEPKVWGSVRDWLRAHYTFAETDVSQIDFSNSIHAPILLQCMAHHCCVRVDTENEMYPTLRKEWRKVGLFLDFVPGVKTLCYRKASHAMLAKERWATKDFVSFVEHEQKLAKAWLGLNRQFTSNTMSASAIQQAQQSINPAVGRSSVLNLEGTLSQSKPAPMLSSAKLAQKINRASSDYCVIVDKSGLEHGLDQALRLYIDHMHEVDAEEAGSASRFALALYEEDPNIWLQFATQAYQYNLVDNLKFEDISNHIAFNFGNDHPLLLDFWRQKLDLLFAALSNKPDAAASKSDSTETKTVEEKAKLRVETLDVAKRCVELSKAAFGRSHATTAWYHSLYGHVCVRADSLDTAVEQYKRSLELSLKNKGPESTFVAGAYSCLRDAFSKKGDLDAAFDYAIKAQNILVKLPDKKKLLVNQKHIADIQEMRGEVDDALSWTQKTLTFLQSIGTELELSRTSFDFTIISQAVRLSVCQREPSLPNRMKWERKLRDVERQKRNVVQIIEYKWTISDLSELPAHVAELLHISQAAVFGEDGGDGADANGNTTTPADIELTDREKEALDELYQLVKFCDPEFSSVFDLQLHAPPVLAAPNC
ncbi:unnamed protein product [Amoebophrya sp. A25]|nr:unnamed protein product [Amoebophrya sp. A25]|eukprot:GSA25T00021133001.1